MTIIRWLSVPSLGAAVLLLLQSAGTAGAAESPSAGSAAAPRQWKVFVLHASHLDPGWMDIVNDVSEGYTMGLPQVLARSGIRGILFGPGGKANLRGIVPLVPRLWHWTTPDGSRVHTVSSP